MEVTGSSPPMPAGEAVPAAGDGACELELKPALSRLRHVEAELRRAEDRFHALLDASPDTVGRVNRAGQIVALHSHDSAQELIPTAPWRGRTAAELWPPDRAEEAMKLVARALDTREIQRAEYSIPELEGTAVWRHVESQFVACGPDDVLVVLRDITPQKQSEAHLQQVCAELEKKFRERSADLHATSQRLVHAVVQREYLGNAHDRLSSVLEATTDFVSFLSPQGRVLYLNGAARRALGRSEEEDTGGLTIHDLHPAGTVELLQREAMPVAEQGCSWSGEAIWRSSGGGEVPTSMVVLAHRSRKGQVTSFSTVSRDITERRRAEEAWRLLAHVNRVSVMGEMATAMAHELNQPLGVIANNAQACLRWFREPEIPFDEVGEALAETAAEALRAGEILRSVGRWVSRAPIRRDPLCINRLIQDTEQLIGGEFRRHQVALQLDLQSPLPPVEGDRIQIQQVLVNLLRNALEAMEEVAAGRRRVTLQTRETPRGVEVSVADAGRGIREIPCDRIFDPYFSTKSDGLGMGLPICRSIVQAHGGRLSTAPSIHGGACFVFNLPLPRD